MNFLFNFADGCCYDAQRRSKKAAELFGGFDKVFRFSKKQMDQSFCEKHKIITGRKRGAGLWIWKYYFALKLLDNSNFFGKQIPEESYVCYCDSDLYFIESIDLLINCLKKDTHNQSVMVFRGWNWYKASAQTKRDAFILCEADEKKYTQTSMRCGGFWIFKKDNTARVFFNEMMQYSLDPRIIVPPPNQPQYDVEQPLENQMGQPNYPNFLRHAEDEALITIVSKKHSLYPYRFPAITKEEEKQRVEDNLKNGGWRSQAEAYTMQQYPELVLGKSNYPKLLLYTQDTD